MVIKSKATPIDGLRILGETFSPADDDSAQAVYERNGRVCGVTYESGAVHPYLRYSPGYQLPPNARDKGAWRRFVWNFEDDRAVNLKMDVRDGEVLYISKNLPGIVDLEKTVDGDLDFVLGDELYDALVDYVRSFTSDGGA